MDVKNFINESDFSDQKKAVSLLIVVAQDILNKINKPLKKFNLSLTQINILHVISKSEKTLTVGEIKKCMLEANPNVSRALRKLENKGLIKKERDTQDQRVVFIHIAEEGERLLKLCEEDAENKNDIFDLSDSETKELISLLMKL